LVCCRGFADIGHRVSPGEAGRVAFSPGNKISAAEFVELSQHIDGLTLRNGLAGIRQAKHQLFEGRGGSLDARRFHSSALTTCRNRLGLQRLPVAVAPAFQASVRFRIGAGRKDSPFHSSESGDLSVDDSHKVTFAVDIFAWGREVPGQKRTRKSQGNVLPDWNRVDSLVQPASHRRISSAVISSIGLPGRTGMHEFMLSRLAQEPTRCIWLFF
jgi:hypothetical protein